METQVEMQVHALQLWRDGRAHALQLWRDGRAHALQLWRDGRVRDVKKGHRLFHIIEWRIAEKDNNLIHLKK